MFPDGKSPNRRILRFPELLRDKGVPFSRVHLSRLEARGEFPRRVKMSANSVGWFEDEIDRWLEERAAAREVADG